MKILVPIDESKCSIISFESVMRRVWPPETEFLICTVIPDSLARSRYLPGTDPETLLRMQNEQESVAQKVVVGRADELRRSFPNENVSAAVMAGDAADEIVETAVGWGADLIVLGSHGRHGASRYALGSVAEAVVEKAPCAIEVIRQPRLGGRSFMKQSRILVCYDGSNNSDAALEWLSTCSWTPDQDFVLLTVLAPFEETFPAPKMKGKVFQKHKQEVFDSADRMLAQRVDLLRARLPQNTVIGALKEGYAVEQIVSFATQWHADLIVMGAHSTRRACDAVLGSVARQVTESADCSVKIIKEPAPRLRAVC